MNVSNVYQSNARKFAIGDKVWANILNEYRRAEIIHLVTRRPPKEVTRIETDTIDDNTEKTPPLISANDSTPPLHTIGNDNTPPLLSLNQNEATPPSPIPAGLGGNRFGSTKTIHLGTKSLSHAHFSGAMDADDSSLGLTHIPLYRIKHSTPQTTREIACSFYIHPTRRCKAENEKCRFSHGLIMAEDRLIALDSNADRLLLKPRCRCMVAMDDNLWYKGGIVSMRPRNSGVVVQVDKHGQTAFTVSIDSVVPLPNKPRVSYQRILDSTPLITSASMTAVTGATSAVAATEAVTHSNEIVIGSKSKSMEWINGELVSNDEPFIPVPNEFCAWQKNTSGFGMRFLQRRGYQYGKGVGKSAQGRIDPVPVHILRLNAGLGFAKEEIKELKVKSGAKSAEEKKKYKQNKNKHKSHSTSELFPKKHRNAFAMMNRIFKANANKYATADIDMPTLSHQVVPSVTKSGFGGAPTVVEPLFEDLDVFAPTDNVMATKTGVSAMTKPIQSRMAVQRSSAVTTQFNIRLSNERKLQLSTEKLATLRSANAMYRRKLQQSSQPSMCAEYRNIISENNRKIERIERSRLQTEVTRSKDKAYNKESFKF